MKKLWVLVALVLPLALATAARAEPPADGAQKMTLEEALRRAVAKNPNTVIAIEEVRRAEAIVREVRASSLPTLIGNATYTRLDSDRSLSGRVIAAADSFNANLLLTVPIIAPKPWAQWSHAKDNVEATRFTADEAKRQLAIGVGRAYLAIFAQKRVIESLERARDTARVHFDFIKKRLEGGIGTRLDSVRAEQEVMTDESSVHTARAGLARAREALAALVGVDGPVDTADEPSFGAPDLASALGDTRRRSDVAAAESRVRAADHVVRDDWTDLSPYLTGFFSPFYQNPASLTQPLTGWQAQIVLTIPFYDGGLRYGLWDERASLAAEARATVDQTQRQARSDVRAAYEAVKRNEDAFKAAKDAAQLAKRALDMAQLAYEGGLTTNIEVVDAERRARDAETSVAVAEDGVRQAKLDLAVSSGKFP